jgi:hypothetical protein
MSFFNEQYENHPVHGICQQLIEKIEQAEIPDLTGEEVIAIARCQHVAEYAIRMLESSDPELIAKTTIDQIQNTLTSLSEHWDQWPRCCNKSARHRKSKIRN